VGHKAPGDGLDLHARRARRARCLDEAVGMLFGHAAVQPAPGQQYRALDLGHAGQRRRGLQQFGIGLRVAHQHRQGEALGLLADVAPAGVVEQADVGDADETDAAAVDIGVTVCADTSCGERTKLSAGDGDIALALAAPAAASPAATTTTTKTRLPKRPKELGCGMWSP